MNLPSQRYAPSRIALSVPTLAPVNLPGQLITFYSYKGGTGRSMAVANTVCQLATNHRVLAIDWDLDAPGLTQYLRPLLVDSDFDLAKGVIDLLEKLKDSSLATQTIDLNEFIVGTRLPNLSFMKAGVSDERYPSRIASFDWAGTHATQPDLFRDLASLLVKDYDFVVIDSRTGLSDISGICTTLMPEILVLVFTPNTQSLEGGVQMVRRAVEYRSDSDDLRPLLVVPLPSRIDFSEPALLEAWRFAEPTSAVPMGGYQRLFESLYKTLYSLPKCDLSRYFDDVQIQHVPRYSYGESIAVLQERGDRLSLSRSFGTFAKYLTSSRQPWEYPGEPTQPNLWESSADDTYAFPPRIEQLDTKWRFMQQQTALTGLRRLNLDGFAEFSTSLRTQRPNASHGQLLDAARQVSNTCIWLANWFRRREQERMASQTEQPRNCG